MNTWKNIEEFEKSLSNLPRKKAPTYLYSRVQSKLMKEETPLVSWRWSAFGISVMIILNVFGVSAYLEAEDKIDMTSIYESMLTPISTFSYDEE